MDVYYESLLVYIYIYSVIKERSAETSTIAKRRGGHEALFQTQAQMIWRVG